PKPAPGAAYKNETLVCRWETTMRGRLVSGAGVQAPALYARTRAPPRRVCASSQPAVARHPPAAERPPSRAPPPWNRGSLALCPDVQLHAAVRRENRAKGGRLTCLRWPRTPVRVPGGARRSGQTGQREKKRPSSRPSLKGTQ